MGIRTPRYAFGVYTISIVPSAPARSSLRLLTACIAFTFFSRALMQRLSILHYLIRNSQEEKILIVFAIFASLQRNVEQQAHHLVGQHLLFRAISEQPSLFDQNQTLDLGDDITPDSG